MSKNIEAPKQSENRELFEKRACGIIVINSENSKFNADFSGLPRKLPDENSTVFATDKSLKYCIRKYLLDQYTDEKVFMWRRKIINEQDRKQGDPLSIDENFIRLFQNDWETKINEEKKRIENEIKKLDQNSKKDEIKRLNSKIQNIDLITLLNRNEIILSLMNCIDVRLFGITFAPGTEGRNVSITGPIQISYGINRFPENIYYTNQILSPFSPDKKEQPTIGNETKGLEYHYVFDFIINPHTLTDVLSNLPEIENKKNISQTVNKDNKVSLIKTEKEYILLSKSDISKFKQASCRGVNHVNSTTKIGSENELFVYIEYDKPYFFQNIGYLLDIKKDRKEKKTIINFKKLFDYFFNPNYGVLVESRIGEKTDNIEKNKNIIQSDKTKKNSVNIEIYFNPIKTSIEGIETPEGIEIKQFEILSQNPISNK